METPQNTTRDHANSMELRADNLYPAPASTSADELAEQWTFLDATPGPLGLRASPFAPEVWPQAQVNQSAATKQSRGQRVPAGPLAPLSLPRYPPALDCPLTDKPFTPEMYPELLEKYGRHLVLLCRFGGEEDAVTACVTATGLVKLGVFGRCMHPVARELVLPYLGPDEAAYFAERPLILVCTPPMPGAQAYAIAEMVALEDAYISSKVPLLDALDSVGALDVARAGAIVDDVVRFLEAGRLSYDTRVVQVEPPTGEWNIYTRGGAIPPPDRLTSAIKGFAAHSSRVFPPLPPTDDAEADALLHVHDLLMRHGLAQLAKRLLQAALTNPAFAHLCHRADVFDPERNPPLAVDWADYGPAMLRYLFSEELTHAARRDINPERVTLEAPYVFTGRELVAMRVPHGPASLEQAFARLNTYMGGYLADLDLSKSLITGSAIAAALIVTDVEREGFEDTSYYTWSHTPEHAAFQQAYLQAHPAEAPAVAVGNESTPAPVLLDDDVARQPTPDPAAPADVAAAEYAKWRRERYGRGFEAYIASHYPPTKTIPRDNAAYDAVVGAAESGSSLVFETSALEGGRHTLTITAARVEPDGDVVRHTAVLDVVSGADLDVAIDVETNEEFDRVVAGHYRVIRASYPDAVLTKITREDPMDARYNWAVTNRCPGELATFRPVEFYRANFNHVVTHHVGMVSGAYTALFSRDEPQFVVSSRLAIAMDTLATPNYYYFASRKTPPQLIVLKYLQRGFGLDIFPAGIKSAIAAAFHDDPLWDGLATGGTLRYPARYAKGCFSAYSLASELKALYA